VADLTVTASLLAQTLPSSPTGGASRFPAGTKSSSESTANSGSQFPELLAGLVSTSKAAEGDSHTIPTGVVPRPDLDTAAGTGTPPAGNHADWRDAVLPSVLAATATGKRSLARKAAGGHADPTEQSDVASRLGLPAAKTPGPEQQPAIPAVSTLQLQPTLPYVTAVTNLPAPEDSTALSGADDEALTQSPVQMSNRALWAGRDVAVAGKTSVLEREAGLGLSGVVSGVAHEAKGPATPVSPRAVPQAGRQHQEAPADRTPGRQESGLVAPQESAELRFTSVSAASGAEEQSRHAAAMAMTQAMPVAEMGLTPAAPGAAERDGPPVASSSDAPATIRTEDVPSSGQEQGPFATASGAVPNSEGFGSRPDMGPAAGATNSTNALRTLFESVPASPAPTRHPLSADAGGDGAEDEMRAPAERVSTGTDDTDSSGRHADRMQASEQPSRRSSSSVVAQLLALSGQVPRTVESIPSARSPKVAPASLAESQVRDTDPQVRAVAASTPDRGELAFAMQMQVMPPRESSVPGESRGRMTAADESRRIPVTTTERDVPVVEPVAASENRPSLSGEPEQAPARGGRGRRPEEAPPERAEVPTGMAASKVLPHAAQDAQLRTGTGVEPPEAAVAKPVRPQDAMDSESKPEAPSMPAVRDMKFEVTGGESRVEVRLSERGGEVKMTVRTPDANLAGTLRENLPALSTRLSESGFKSEAWHPAASSTNEWRHTAQSSAGGASQDANSHSREHQGSQDGAGQRRPRIPQEPVTQKQKGKDFAWLMSSLR
jgi:hypothetical protein